uniref:RNase H type-1 domain-containing protein n=1 Tax=Cannabis sativa TaxID=3483 RepID=A0A803P560_CANSA
MAEWPSPCNGQVTFLKLWPSDLPHAMVKWPSSCQGQAVRFPLRSIVSDCLTLVRRLQKRSFDRLALSGFIAAIASSLFSFPGASISFIPRTENTIAHNLAREALGTDEEMIWNNLSSSL